MNQQVKKMVIGAVLAALGFCVIPVIVVLAFLLHEPQEVRFETPAAVTAPIDEPGRYYLWNEYRTTYDGRTFNRSKDLPDGLAIEIRDPRGERLELQGDGTITSTSGSDEKVSIGYVEVDAPGELAIDVSGGAETRILSFSQSRFIQMLFLIIGGLVASMLLGLGGMILIILGIVRFAQSRSAASAARKLEPHP